MTERNKIIYGRWSFTDDDIHSGNVYLTISLMSDALEANTFSATVECADREILDFERNSPLTYYSRGRQIGIFYVQSITREGPTTYSISATSAIGLLIEGLHYGGIYAGQTVAEILPSICGTVPYVVKTELRDIALYGWLPVASPRDNLSQLLFAVGAFVKTDLDGILHIEGLWDGVSGIFGRDRMYMGPSVERAAKVTQVVVTEHQYIEGSEETQLFEGTAQEGDVITFDAPMSNLQANGFSILESNANYAKLTAGAGTLTGSAYIHNTRQVTEEVLQASEPNIKTVTEATLVSLVNSRAVAKRVANYYKSVETINAAAAYQEEAPGNILSSWHPYDLEAVPACLEQVDISLSASLKAQEALLVGFVPIKDEQAVIYDHQVILTGEGTWVPPVGTVSAHVVLIGGGGPGAAGEAGQGSSARMDGTDSDRKYYSLNNSGSGSVRANASVSSPGVAAGSGGEGGAKGVQGYVLEADLDLSGGESFAYHCGGAGETPGETGGATTFGQLSSASGAPLPNGYVDVTTGIAYALPGTDGAKGGDGGSGSGKGEDVAGAAGGAGAQGESYSDSDNRSFTETYPGEPDTDMYTVTFNAQGAQSCSPSGGGGAGGGTETNPGSKGGDAYLAGNPDNVAMNFAKDGASVYTGVMYICAGAGGDGADGDDAVTYGSSGGGGHGGGGCGAIGAVSNSATLSASVNVLLRSSGTISAWAQCQKFNLSARGGEGGRGGRGKEGCIIIYYGVKSTVKTGPVVTAQNKYLLDKYGRKVVV